MLFKMNEKNVLKFYSAEKLLRFLNINFGDQNKKQTAQNKIRFLKMGKKPFAEYLAEFQQHIKDTGFNIDNQKYFFLIGCSWEFQNFLVQHDTDLMTFDKMGFICQILWIRDQLANQAKPENYPNFTHSISAPNSNMLSTNNNNFPARDYLTPFNLLRPQFQTRKVCRERLPKFELGSLGKRSERSNTLGTSGTLATFQTCRTFLTFISYIYVVISQKNSFFF